jgi:hypothetical protein
MRSRLYKEARAAAAAANDAVRAAAAFGFLATAQAADAMIRDLAAAGLNPADPSLAPLRFNAALGNSSSETRT